MFLKENERRPMFPGNLQVLKKDNSVKLSRRRVHEENCEYVAIH